MFQSILNKLRVILQLRKKRFQVIPTNCPKCYSINRANYCGLAMGNRVVNVTDTRTAARIAPTPATSLFNTRTVACRDP